MKYSSHVLPGGGTGADLRITKDLYFLAFGERLGVPPDELEAGVREVRDSLDRLLPVTRYRISVRKWMDGWVVIIKQ